MACYLYVHLFIDVGFVPLSSFFKEVKQGSEVLIDSQLNYAAKMYALLKYIPMLKGLKMAVMIDR